MTSSLDLSASDSPKPVVAMLVADDITLLDVIGPHTALMAATEIHLVASSMSPITSDTGLLMHPTTTFDDAPDVIDVLLVPGGPATAAMMEDEQVISFLRHRAPGAKYVTAVCTGTLVLGAAGLLEGRRATAHWAVLDLLPLFGAEPVDARVVIDGNLMTGGGVTAGIDFGLTLLAELVGPESAALAQLAMEYAPEPPFNSGTPHTAAPEHVAIAKAFISPLAEAIRSAHPGR